MARIENTSARRYDINWKGAMVASIPRCAVDEVTGARVNGAAEVADDVIAEFMAGDAWAKAVFASGDLVRVGDVPATPEAVVSPVDFAAPADLAGADNSKGKSKK